MYSENKFFSLNLKSNYDNKIIFLKGIGFMKIKKFNINKKYSESSGIIPYYDSNFEMILNEYGIFEEKTSLPINSEINESTLECCPNFNFMLNEDDIGIELFSNINGIKHDKRIGYYKSLYVGYVKEADYRLNGSSGGIGTWIFKELLEQKYIDKVIHVKKSKRNDLLFEYQISTSIEEIIDGSKTKYYPVELSKVLNIVKNHEGNFAVIGIPSFIMALRLLAKKDIVIKRRIKFMIGIISGHQKSSRFTDAFGWEVGIEPGNIMSINYRKKVMGKSAGDYSVEIIGTINGKTRKIVKPAREFSFQNWGMGFFKTLNSDFIDDVFNETADLTLGDAWLKDYVQDSLGNNVVIVRDQIIDDIIKNAIINDKLNLDKVDVEVIFKSQEAHYRHTHDELAYRLYKIRKDDFVPQKRVNPNKNIPFLRRRIQDQRELISTKSHIIFQKAVEKNNYNYFLRKMKKYVNTYKRLYFIQKLFNLGTKGIFKKIWIKITK